VHAFDIIEIGAASSGHELVKFLLDIPGTHAGDTGRGHFATASPSRAMTRYTSLEELFASLGFTGSAGLAAGKDEPQN